MPSNPVATLIVIVVALGAAACSDSGSSDADPARSAPPSSSPADDASSEPTVDAVVGPEVPFPGVPPTTGRLLREKSVEITAPTGWHFVPPMLKIDSGVARGSGESLIITDQPSMGAGLGLPPLPDSRAAALMLRDARAEGGTYERADDVVVDGARFVHVTGTNERGHRFEQIEVDHQDRLVTVTFVFRPRLLEKEPQIVEAVFNSIRWR